MIKKFIVFLFVFILLMYTCNHKKNLDGNIVINSDYKETKKISQNKKDKIKVVSLSYNNNIKKLNIEDYVIGVVACEMPASFNIEALKAMAVAARTFALYKVENNKNYILSSTTRDQCYYSKKEMKNIWKDNYSKYYNKINKAVADTNNQYMTYKDKIIYAAYFSISNGYTEDVKNVFGNKLSYLTSVESPWDKDYNYNAKTITISEKDFLEKLNIKDTKIKNIKLVKNKSGRVNYLIINDIRIKGTKVRSLLSLRSTDFIISNKNNKIYIKTKGYGHGVGMSQYGAEGMSNQGYNYDEILKYYYSGIKIMNN